MWFFTTIIFLYLGKSLRRRTSALNSNQYLPVVLLEPGSRPTEVNFLRLFKLPLTNYYASSKNHPRRTKCEKLKYEIMIFNASTQINHWFTNSLLLLIFNHKWRVGTCRASANIATTLDATAWEFRTIDYRYDYGNKVGDFKGENGVIV
jgi:hypothetical protein